MRKVLGMTVLFLSISFSEVITFENNWAENPLFNMVSESPNGVEIVFSMQKLVIEEMEIDGLLMKSFGVPGMFLPNDEGAPNLTGAGRYIAVPQGAAVQVTILDARTEIYHNVEVAPAPNIPFENDDSPVSYVKDMAIYSRDANYPETPVRLSELMQIRGVDVVILGVTPFQYNPVTKDLIVYKDIRIKLDFIGGNGHFGEDRLRSRFWEPILQGHLLNYKSLPKIDFYLPKRIRAKYGYEYIIIVPDDRIFKAWGDTIKAWRKLQGISCEVFTLTEVGGSSATAIEAFLDSAYHNWNPAPVAFLLLSDYPSSGDVYGITSPTYDSYFVSDNIYADVDRDDLPDMHHARICAQTGSQLSTMIGKFLSYERAPYTAANFYDAPLVAVAWQSGGKNPSWFQICGEVIRGFFNIFLGKNPARQYSIYDGKPTPGCDWSTASNTEIVTYYADLGYIPESNPYDSSWWNNGSADGINAAINSGAFLVQHRDHGIDTGWVEPPYYNSDLDDLTNTMFTFVYSTNCYTGRYDEDDMCFAEKFHRIDCGALGVNAASSMSYLYVNDTYVWGMYDCLWPEFMPDYPNPEPTHDNLRPSMAMTYGKYFLHVSSWPSNPEKKVYTYHLFHHHGDCFITLYSEIPQNLTVAHDPILPAGQEYFTVTSNVNSVIALTVNGEIIGVGEGTGSPVDIPIPPQMAGNTMHVTVTKANYYRYEEDVPIHIQGEIYDGHGGPLTAAGSPYYIISDAWVPEGETLTIEAGVELYFESTCRITAYGLLDANGNVANPTYFISTLQHNGITLMTGLQLEDGGYFKPEGYKQREVKNE